MTALPQDPLPHASSDAAESAVIIDAAPARQRWPRVERAVGVVARVLCFVMAVGVLAQLWRLIGADPGQRQVAWTLQVLTTGGAFLSCALVLLNVHRQWHVPRRRLLGLMPLVRARQAPIEQLDEIDGGLMPLVGPLKELFHDLRRQSAETAELHHEMRLRIATRTEALERTVGSLRQQANRDGLTGLNNRRALDATLPQLIDRCRATGGDLCVLMVDLDHFKSVNDTLGHQAGDQLLVNVARLVRSTIREDDLAFRYGGDEIVIVLPGCLQARAEGLAQRLRTLGDALGRTLRLETSPGLSIGVASLEGLRGRGGSTAGELLKAADADLYERKTRRKAGLDR